MKRSDYAPCGCVPLYGACAIVEGYIPCDEHRGNLDKSAHCERLQLVQRLSHLSRLQDELASAEAMFDGSTYEMRVELYGRVERLKGRIAEACRAYQLTAAQVTASRTA